MSLYTFTNLLQDCVARRYRTKGTKNEKSAIYVETWGAINDWIVSRFEVGKGVTLGNFATLTWEHLMTGRNIKKSRPIFLISESFSKSHFLPYKRILTQPTVSAAEEMNFTKLAIKFSKTLTKDQVFSATRDLFQRLGEMIGTGKKLSIDFKVGRLLSKQRVAHMVFDPRCFPKMHTVTPSIIGSPPSVLGDLDDYDIADLASLEMDIIAQDALENASSELQGDEPAHPETDEEPQVSAPVLSGMAPSTLPEHLLGRDPKIALHEMLSSITEVNGDLEDVLNTPKDDISDHQSVLDAAYLRHIQQVEKELEADALAQLEVHKKHNEDCMAIMDEKNKKKYAAVSLQLSIQSQMHERNDLRQALLSADKGVQGAISIIPISPREDDPIESVSPMKRKDLEKKISKFAQLKREEITKFLQIQIKHKDNVEKAYRAESMEYEQQQLQKVEKEVLCQKEQDLKDLIARRKYLTEGWKRDNHLKTMIKMRKKITV